MPLALSRPALFLRSSRDWLPACGLLLATCLVGPALGAAARPLFILGCAAVGWWTWKRGAAAHLQSSMVLFCFAALARRLVDLAVGYDASGLMLVGPLLAITMPLVATIHDPEAEPRAVRPNPQGWPIALVALCVVYATTLSIFQGDWMNAASNSVKWAAPLAYAHILGRVEKPEALVQAAASAFLVLLPAMGAYGIVQYVNPPDWDRYWMTFASILSAGQPVPFGVRTFSTMNGPASFATFTACGMLLVFFLRPGWRGVLLTAPAATALLLSSYRTAWIALAAGIAFAALFKVTRAKAFGTVAAIVMAVAAVTLLTPFGDAITDRLASFGEGSGDGSAQERLQEFVQLWQLPDSNLFGMGFTITDVGSAGAMAIDGAIIACWVNMGIFVGLACLAALLLAIAIAVRTAWRDGRPAFVVCGAVACGALVQMPLANITVAELGFLFWTFAVLLPSPSAASASSRSSASCSRSYAP